MNGFVLSTVLIVFLGLLVVAATLPCHQQRLYGASTDPSVPALRWQYEPLHGWSDPSGNGSLNFIVSYTERLKSPKTPQDALSTTPGYKPRS